MNKASDQTPNIPQYLEHGVLPPMQRINQRMRHTFSSSTRLSEENNAWNTMPRNNDEFDDINVPNNPSNSVRETNISSFNVQGNTIKNSFNKKSYVGPGVLAPPSRKLESVCVVFRFWCITARVDLSFRERGNQLRTNTGNNARMTIDSTNFVFLGAPQTQFLSQLLTVLPLAKNPFFFLADLVSVNCYFYYIVLDALRGSVFSHHPHQNSLFVAN